MVEALDRMFSRYTVRSVEDFSAALREILQELALLGLWRSKFFEKAAFYGGTSLRILYGLDRFSEELDFTLIKPDPEFDLSRYLSALEREIQAFGFEITATRKEKVKGNPIQSAFLKADTLRHSLAVKSVDNVIKKIPRGQVLKIRIEIDTNPPPGFETENKFLLQPIPFSVRSLALPDLFAGKMHAVLCRQWKSRVKGRDWYDLVWFAANHPNLHLSHLRQRMIQSGHLKAGESLSHDKFLSLASKAIENLNVDQARKEVEPFLKNPDTLAVWSKEFFLEVIKKIVFI
ncbi:MAG: nucleotidyl transferase AbiEii/AbiGii toxin family protein [Deltaproteobacteria bacterium]|nr:nucleotidyl transferase AbiEii/AbiGii toxin family protein [Deltaproteobacteria bacterium]